MSRRLIAVLAACAGLVVALVVVASHATGDPPAVSGGVSAGELATVIEDLNRQALVGSRDLPAVAGSAGQRLAAVTPSSAAKPVAAASIRAEAERVTAMAARLRARGGVGVRAVRVAVEAEKQEAAVRVVTLRVSRTLGDGQVWEELFPYAVIDQDVTGTVLRAGQVYAIDRESGESGLIPPDLEPYWRA